MRHLVNNHDELWDYEKPAEESLKRIKLDKKVLKVLIGTDLVVEGMGSIDCKFCRKTFRTLDELVTHVMFDHPPVAYSAYQSGGLYLSSEFLTNNGYVENFEKYCVDCDNVESLVVKEHCKVRSDSARENWEDIDSEEEWEVEVKVKAESRPEEIRETERKGNKSGEPRCFEEIEVLREGTEEVIDLYESCEDGSMEIGRFGDTSLEAKVVEELYGCEKCGDAFDTKSDLEDHMETYHEGSECCMFCPFKGSKMDIVVHLSRDCEMDEARERMVSEPEPEEICRKRGDVFGRAAGLQTHVERYHGGYEERFHDEERFHYEERFHHEERSCDKERIYDEERIHAGESINDGVRIHDDSDEKVCDEERTPDEERTHAGESINSGERIHDASNEKVKDEIYNCNECGHKFKETQMLNMHKDLHHEGKEKCSFCSFVGRKADLWKHIANDCGILGYEKETEVCSGVDNCKNISGTIKSLDEHDDIRLEFVSLDENEDLREEVVSLDEHKEITGTKLQLQRIPMTLKKIKVQRLQCSIQNQMLLKVS